MFNHKLKKQLQEAENIIHSFKTMLLLSHLSENKSAACEFARREIYEYERKYAQAKDGG